MKIIDRYIGGSFLMAFVSTLFVLVLVMSIGVVFQITKFLAQGVPWVPVLKLFASSMPSALEFALPVSTLVAALLVIGRFSSDSEIIALKACGVSVSRACRSVFFLAGCVSVFGVYNNLELSPRSHYMCRTIRAELINQAGLVMLPAGRPMKVGEGLTVYVGQREGDMLHNVRIFDDREDFSRFILATTGQIVLEEGSPDVLLKLWDVKMDPISRELDAPGHASSLEVRLENVRRFSDYTKGDDDLTTFGLIDAIRDVHVFDASIAEDEVALVTMKLRTILTKHIALGLLCFTFSLVAVPMGIQHNRRDSYVGIIAGLGIMVVTYLFVFGAESLSKHPVVRPDLIICLPPLITALMGLRLMRKAS